MRRTIFIMGVITPHPLPLSTSGEGGNAENDFYYGNNCTPARIIGRTGRFQDNKDGVDFIFTSIDHYNPENPR